MCECVILMCDNYGWKIFEGVWWRKESYKYQFIHILSIMVKLPKDKNVILKLYVEQYK